MNQVLKTSTFLYNWLEAQADSSLYIKYIARRAPPARPPTLARTARPACGRPGRPRVERSLEPEGARAAARAARREGGGPVRSGANLKSEKTRT